MLVQSLICAAFYVFVKFFDYQLGTLYAFRPIVVCPLLGLILGDLQTGLALGASIEALFMGSVSIGAYIPPDATSAGVLCTAYVILLGLDTEVAVGLAMPIGTLVLALSSLFQPITNWLLSFVPKFAAEGNGAKLTALHFFIALYVAPVYFAVIFFAVYLGSDAVAWITNTIPEFVLNGFGAAANILPVMGFAMLLRLIYRKELLPFLFLGFLMTSYMGVPVLGVSLIAIIIAVLMLGIFGNKPAAAQIEGADDDDF
ncbi:PTS sugar transporter subunit IIC [Collinsella stercoris]|uniref:PTS mannose/fructose/sorbose/N-acetylgalactosamine transporter subunit IIC n=1 Tax=Collinsella stercoris TaxID=147206 RepID=UPI0023F49A37|nr:PTS sugar transporter subunit IIC [Collinsella stercoris]